MILKNALLAFIFMMDILSSTTRAKHQVVFKSYGEYQMMLRHLLTHRTCTLLMILATTGFGGFALADEVFQQAFIKNYCIECHDSETELGGFNIESLKSVTTSNAVEWQKIWEQVSLKEMPPKTETQPDYLERMNFVNSVVAGLQTASKNQGGFHEFLLPTKGNYVDHELLFSDLGKDVEPPSTPSRMWRIHPHAYLVKLKELVHNTPKYNPKYPGQLASGDPVMVSKIMTDTGDLRLSLGSDQVMGIRNGSGWTNGFPSVRPVQSLSDERGLQDYPVMYEVTSDEMQLLVTGAKSVLKHMIVGSVDVPDYMWRDPDKFTLYRIGTMIVNGEKKNFADREGCHLYIKGYQRKYSPFMDIMETEELPTQAQLEKLVPFLFNALTGRNPRVGELNEQIAFIQNEVKALGKIEGLIVGCAPMFLHPEALYRYEFGNGEVDQYGRVMLAGDELANSIAGALTYMSPDPQLQLALAEGNLKSRADVLREVMRIMDDGSIRKPRILRFFQEYFDYHRAPVICKDTDSLKKVGVHDTGNQYNLKMNYLVSETDRLIEYILEADRQVLYELLTTNECVVRVRPTIKEEKPFDTYNNATSLSFYDNSVTRYSKRQQQTSEIGIEDIERPIFIREYWASTSVTGPSPWEMLTFPATERCGILTQPSWLIAHSDAMENHAILRGRWIRERLLGGGVPEVPITVDAVLADEPTKTLRHRMRVTQENECWRCHQKMDPLGLPFEVFNHVGKFRKYKHGTQVDENGNPVDASGEIIASGVETLDGKVEDAFELIHRLAKSEHVEQVFVRHAFRYWMGRNETISDAPTLQAAHKAYQDNGGSMKALIISLLTSDSFLYRKPVKH
ncbi:DUF1588 domain-containing protein [bacterium]|nr:DUF1588 domain-containing protein [bacterium]